KEIDHAIDYLRDKAPAFSSILAAGRATQQRGGGLSQILDSAGYAASLSGNSALERIGGPLLKGGAAVSGVLGSIAGGVSGVQSAVGTFKQLGDSIASFTRLAQPFVAERWDRAWEDLYAVIGRKTAPVLDGLTAGVRALGDAFASVLPDLSSFGNWIKDL